MTKREQRYLEAVEQSARDFWRMLKTSTGNRVGHGNPYFLGLVEHMETIYWWVKEPPAEERT